MNVAIVGAGLIGGKRAKALSDNDSLNIICDVNPSVGVELANKFDAKFTINYKDICINKNIDVAIVSVVNKFISPIAIDILLSGKHVLCEKPLGRNVKESQNIIEAAKKQKKLVKTGFNHRFHPGILKAKEYITKGEIGKLINIRARYGHGGRPGMENEWRCSKDLCGGGELLDQGVHLIDLISWFADERLLVVNGTTKTSFWEIEVEDNAFFTLEYENLTAQCHVSWTNWKNIFSFEIFGDKGYIRIDGIGGSYGQEKIEIGKRNIKGGIPNIDTIHFNREDNSWQLEWHEFQNAILENREPIGNGIDGLRANKIIEAIYLSSNINKRIPVNI